MGVDRLQCQYERLNRINTDRISYFLVSDPCDLIRAVIIVSARIWLGLPDHHLNRAAVLHLNFSFRNNFSHIY